MSTLKQIEANRVNARKSTGPRTPEGKSITRQNAFKHGIFAEAHILIGEDQAAFDALRDDYVDRYQPATPEEESLVSNLINHSWFQVRFRRLEATTWNMRLKDPISNWPLVTAHVYAYKELDFLQRRINATHRQFHRDLEVLTNLQAARKSAASQPEPILEAEPAQVLAPEIGSVPTNRKPPPNPASPRLKLSPGRSTLSPGRSTLSRDRHGAESSPTKPPEPQAAPVGEY